MLILSRPALRHLYRLGDGTPSNQVARTFRKDEATIPSFA